MTTRRLQPLSRSLVLLLSASLVVGQVHGQDMLGETSFSGTPNVSMPQGMNGGGGRFDTSTSVLPSIRSQGQNDERPPVPVMQSNGDAGPVRPLPPNEFQRFVLETSGQALPLFGASFFAQGIGMRNVPNNMPVAPDYRIGPGDQLHIRGWGAVDLDVKATVDRDGMIHIPRVGAVNLLGIRSGQAEDVIRAAVAKYYRDFHLSVSMGQLRGMTIYVVGQARKPGAYTVVSTSTLISALFVSGGPSPTGSMRRIQVKRADKVLAELDLYAFLSKGDKSSDVGLQDGDTIVIPPAEGFVALTGKVSTPAVYEWANGDSLATLLDVAGGLPVVADPRRVQLERVDPSKKPARSVEAFALDDSGLKKRLQNGDLLTISSIVPDFGNAVSLRGNVIQPLRSPWHKGMTVRDLIPNKSYLMSRASVKRQNDVMLTDAEKEKAATLPEIWEGTSSFEGSLLKSAKDAQEAKWKAKYPGQDRKNVERQDTKSADAMDPQQVKESVDTLAERVGNLMDEVNLDYAVVERVDSANFKVKLLPFNLGKALEDASSPENLALEPGDVLTVFSIQDVRVPLAKRQVFVRVEGEVLRPGIYQMSPGDRLPELLSKAGGLTPDAYLFGAAFYREEVKRAQTANLEQLIRRLEAQMQTKLSASASSVSGSDAPGTAQLRMQAEAEAQKQALERMKNLKPSGRIMLGLPSERVIPEDLPSLRLENQDRLMIPARPDFVYVLGSVNTESSLIWRQGASVQYYLDRSGLTSGADKDEMFIIRVDGSVISNNDSWFSNLNHATVLPGDVIVLPEKTDHESAWSVFTRNAKDITQIIYQFSLGAAAIKTLRQ